MAKKCMNCEFGRIVVDDNDVRDLRCHLPKIGMPIKKHHDTCKNWTSGTEIVCCINCVNYHVFVEKDPCKTCIKTGTYQKFKKQEVNRNVES